MSSALFFGALVCSGRIYLTADERHLAQWGYLAGCLVTLSALMKHLGY